jgi:branched-chain amino acid transport system ATP-binding protein
LSTLICHSTHQLILVDEPTEGLAPLIVKVVGKVIREINTSGTTVLLVEQKLPLGRDARGPQGTG